MKYVRDILRDKGKRPVWTVEAEDTVYTALQLMAEKDIGAVLVMESGRLAGILSERDYARKIILKGRVSKDTPVRDIMVENVIGVSPSVSVEECMALMTEKRVRHLPVFEGDRLIGIVSIGDVVKAQIADREFEISQLTDYITGRVR